MKALLGSVQSLQLYQEIQAWLKAPDASINHDAASEKRLKESGIWFVKGHSFRSWLEDPNSFLWIKGFAGCGKSVLCSNAIEVTTHQKGHEKGVGIAFFYFSFEDESKQNTSSMLRSLLLQLADRHKGAREELQKLYELHSTGIPPTSTLMIYLKKVIDHSTKVYIFIDALDESPRSSHREVVLECLAKMRKWALQSVHLLVTSRDEADINDYLEPCEEQVIVMKNAGIAADIANYITCQLSEDKGLRKWERYHDKIRDVLTEKAQGV